MLTEIELDGADQRLVAVDTGIEKRVIEADSAHFPSYPTSRTTANRRYDTPLVSTGRAASDRCAIGRRADWASRQQTAPAV